MGKKINITPEESEEITQWVIENGGLAGVKATGAVLADVLTLVFGANHGSVKHEELMRELRARLMPPGMEWPRFEDEWSLRTGGTAEVGNVTLSVDGSFALNASWYEPGERVKRPAPKVLDADGVEIRVGDEVWVVGDALPSMKVLEIKTADDPDVPEHLVLCGESLSDSKRWRIADQITHRAPVLAADGKPLREGEHVYHVETGAELVIKELPKPGAYQAVAVFAQHASHLTSFDPDRLTHERPDSWDRLEEDAKKGSCDYFGCDADGCHGCPAYDWNTARGGNGCGNAKTLDLVRRARALSERGMRWQA